MTALELEPCTATYQTTQQTIFTRAEDGPRKGAFVAYHTGSFITITPRLVTERTVSVGFLGVPTEYLLTRAAFDSLRLLARREVKA